MTTTEFTANVVRVGNLKLFRSGEARFFCHLEIGGVLKKAMFPERLAGTFRTGEVIGFNIPLREENGWVIIPEMIDLAVIGQISRKSMIGRKQFFEYVGAARTRADERVSAFVWTEGDWNAEIDGSLLRRWFNASPAVADFPKADFYELLGVAPEAMDDQIKSAARRLFIQWHPDTCKEASARDNFERIMRARDTLLDPLRRKKYDVGLKLQQQSELDDKHRAARIEKAKEYHPSLRCGIVTSDGYMLNRFYFVTKISAWEDYVKDGKTCVTSWPEGAKAFETAWV